MIFLLDANVLISLVDTEHPHYSAAVRFFPVALKGGWATCPLVENAFLRIIGHPRYRNGPGSPALARELLRNYLSAPGHLFWPDDLSLSDTRLFPHMPDPGGLTDLYLLALAAKHGGRLATFDRRIDPALVPGGPAALHIVSD